MRFTSSIIRLPNCILSPTAFILTHPVNFPCGRKLEHPEKTHDFRQSVDWLFSHESKARIEHTNSEVKGDCATKAPSDPLTYIIVGFGGVVVRASAPHLWNRGFDCRYGLIWKSLSTLCRKSWVFTGHSAPVSSHRKSWEGGGSIINTVKKVITIVVKINSLG
jgi:hypothetical protein